MQSKKPLRRKLSPDSMNRAPSRGRSAYGARAAALSLLGRPRADREERDRALRGLDPRDRALAEALTSGTFRMRGTIDFYLSHFLSQDIERLPEPVLNILRSAIFQLQFLDRVPDYAVVNESVELAGRFSGGRFRGLVNAVLRRFGQEWESVPLPLFEDDPVRALAIRHSHPDWLVARWLERFGADETVSLLTANNTPARMTLRVRPSGGGLEQDSARLIGMLRGAGFKVNRGEYAPEALVLEDVSNPAGLPGYLDGLFYVQDEAAMLVGRLATPSPDDLVLDLCAAPGGKCTHLAELSGGRALVVAADPSRRRIATLNENLIRLGADTVRVVAAEGRNAPFRAADLVLCDVPCTGTGALRRKPDLRWRITPADLDNLVAVQREILLSAAELVRPGGSLVYGTCSLEPEENESMVRWFLDRRREFRLDPAVRRLTGAVVSSTGCLETFPHRHGIDGAFGARLLRVDGK